MPPKIKICCISSIDEARLAISCGASALGLVSAMPSGPGVVDEDLIAQIICTVPPPIATFLLTAQQNADAIIEQQHRCRPNTLQLVDAVAKSELTRLGADANKIHVLRNGVDLELFHPVDRQQVRTRFGWSGKVLLSVGNLVELKGHHIAIDALRALRDYRLVIVGNGEEKDNLHKLAKHVGVADRVSFVPSLSQAELRDYYGAADALILASSREGWPNVLLEAMACGTPIVATRIGGIPEVVTAPEAGLLVTERTVNSIAAGVNALFASYPNRQATRRYAECFDWRETSDRQMALFRSVLNGAA